MSDDTPKVRYDLKEENFGAIQSLVMQRSAAIRKEGKLTPSRAHIQAEDEIARELITEPCTGQELSIFLARYRNHRRWENAVQAQEEKVHTPRSIEEARQWVAAHQLEPSLQVNTPLKDDDTFVSKIANKRGQVDPTLYALIEKCRPFKVGEVWSFPVNNRKEAVELEKFMSKVAAALGWRVGGRRRSYTFQIYHDRLKVKRLT